MEELIGKSSQTQYLGWTSEELQQVAAQQRQSFHDMGPDPAKPRTLRSCVDVDTAANILGKVDVATYDRIDALQEKNRWLGDEPGSVLSGRRMSGRIVLASELLGQAGYQVRFVTFTFNPGFTTGAREAWEIMFSKQQRIWGEFLRRLREPGTGMEDVRVFATLEPHPGKNGGEHKAWPHVHALIWYKGYLHYNKLWEAWGLGNVKAEVPEGAASVRYCCKYLTKGFTPPDFFMDFSPRIHMTRTTHGFWAILDEPRRLPNDEPKKRRPGPASIREIRDNPMRFKGVLLRFISTTTGEIEYRRVGEIDTCTIVDMLRLRGFTGQEGKIITKDRGYIGNTGRAELQRPPRACVRAGGTEAAAAQGVKLDYSLNCGQNMLEKLCHNTS